MDKERINELPEEETETAVSAQEEAAVTEEEHTEAVSDDAEAIASEESSSEETVTSEENEEEIPEETEEEDLCPVCGMNKKAEDSDYCLECETIMFKRKIPLLGWISGLASIVIGIFAFVLAALVSAPTLQVAKGDVHAQNKCWYSAYQEYSEVSSVTDEINSILGTQSKFVQNGRGLSKRIIESVAKCTSPLDAYSVAQNLLSGEDLTKISFMKKYIKISEEFTGAYAALEEPITAMMEENANAEETYAAFEAVRGTEGIKDIYIDYFIFNAAVYYGEDYTKQAELLEKVDKTAKASNEDYSWLYSLDYANVLYKSGQTNKAVEVVDSVIEQDKTKFDAYELKMNIALDSGDTNNASKTLAEFKKFNEGYDTSYVLEAQFLRRTGELAKAKALCTEAIELYENVPELYRQMALIYLLEEDYGNAYESAYTADNTAYYLAYYMGDSSAYSDPKLINTIYLCAYLSKDKGQASSENSVYIEDILASFTEEDLSDEVIAVVKGEKTVKEVLTEGVCDLA